MNLAQALQIDGATRLGIVGSGGKTAFMFRLAWDYAHPILISTSTHLSERQLLLADEVLTVHDREDIDQFSINSRKPVTLVSGPIQEDGRVLGLNQELLTWLEKFAEMQALPLLVEADGSRMLPLKAPAEHEPVLMKWMNAVAVVVGLKGLHHPINSEWVHRPEIFAKLSQLNIGADIDRNAVVRVMVNPEGGLKSIPTAAKKIAVLNQCDTPEISLEAHQMVEGLLRVYNTVIICQFNNSIDPIQAVINA